MRIKIKKGEMTKIETEIYQAKNGGIYLNWGNSAIRLHKDYADIVARDIDDFDQEQYNKFYNK